MILRIEDISIKGDEMYLKLKKYYIFINYLMFEVYNKMFFFLILFIGYFKIILNKFLKE